MPYQALTVKSGKSGRRRFGKAEIAIGHFFNNLLKATGKTSEGGLLTRLGGADRQLVRRSAQGDFSGTRVGY
jgi:hypothetical protein